MRRTCTQRRSAAAATWDASAALLHGDVLVFGVAAGRRPRSDGAASSASASLRLFLFLEQLHDFRVELFTLLLREQVPRRQGFFQVLLPQTRSLAGLPFPRQIVR